MMIAGEPSGDLHGSNLIKALDKTGLSLRYSGIGGNMMQAEGMTLFFHIKQLSVMGVVEVLAQIRTIKKAFTIYRNALLHDPPDLLLLIDYPGFNLKAAAFAKKCSIPVLYYITPKVWAWNKSRLDKIKKNVDHAAVIFPFEEKIFKGKNIPVTFVGHPLLDVYNHDVAIPTENSSHASSQKKTSPLVIGLLPGSRESEVSALLEILVQSARIIYKHYSDIKFLLSAASSINKNKIAAVLGKYNQDNIFSVVYGSPVHLFKNSDLLIAASGTVTLEAALWGVPMIIVYKMSSLSFFMAKIFVKLKHVGLPNLIAGEEVVPELLQNDATPQKIAQKALRMINSNDLYLMRKRLSMLRTLLGGSGASKRTASIVRTMLQKNL